jgi:hypothetical protein
MLGKSVRRDINHILKVLELKLLGGMIEASEEANFGIIRRAVTLTREVSWEVS